MSNWKKELDSFEVFVTANTHKKFQNISTKIEVIGTCLNSKKSSNVEDWSLGVNLEGKIIQIMTILKCLTLIEGFSNTMDCSKYCAHTK